MLFSVLLVEGKPEAASKECGFYTFVRPMFVKKEHYELVNRETGRFVRLLLCGIIIKVDNKFVGESDLLISKVNGRFLIEES